MKQKLQKLYKSGFIRNVIILTTGTASAQIISFIFSPIITRIYGPENYGIMGSFMAIVTIFAPVAALTYPVSIVLPKDREEAKDLVKLSLLSTILISVILGSILLLFHTKIISIFNLEEISSFLFLVPITVFFAGLSQIIEQWLIRTKKFTISAKVLFLQSLIQNSLKTGIGYFHPIATVLIIVSAFSETIKVILSTFFTKDLRFKTFYSLNIKKTSSFIRLAKKYRDFPLFRAPQVLINAFSQSLPIIMLTSFFGPASVGFYSISRTVLTMPISLIGKSIGDVFYPRISEAANKGENISILIKRATFSLAVLGIIPFAFIIITGPWLFSFIFGEQWEMAGHYSRWIAIWMFFMFINRPSIQALPILKMQKFHLLYTIISLFVQVGALAIGYYVFSNDFISISFFSISGAILYLILIIIIYNKSKIYRNKSYD